MGIPKKGTPEYEVWKNSPDYERRKKIVAEANRKRVITPETRKKLSIAHTVSRPDLRGRPSPKKGKKVSPKAHASILRAAALRAKPIQEDGLPASLFLPNDDEKECVMCGFIKPLDQFFKFKYATDGYHPRCRYCYNATYRSPKGNKNEPEESIESINTVEEQLPDGYKRCRQCLEVKPFDEFGNQKAHKDGRETKCRECMRQSSDTIRKHNLRKYGITPEQYNAMLEEQGGVCACCGKSETSMFANGQIKPLAVDHCHQLEVVRGLLCHQCNAALGLLYEDPNRIKALLKYVEERCIW